MGKKSTAGESHSDRKITVKGIRREEIDTKRIAEVYMMMAERAVKARKQKEVERPHLADD